MADPAVFKMDQMTPVGRGEGVISHPMCGVACPSETITTGVSVFQPGVAIPMHYHNCEEMVVVLEGEGECEIDGVVTPLKAQDAGYAPTGGAPLLPQHRQWRHEDPVGLRRQRGDPHLRGDGHHGAAPVAPGPDRQLARCAARPTACEGGGL